MLTLPSLSVLVGSCRKQRMGFIEVTTCLRRQAGIGVLLLPQRYPQSVYSVCLTASVTEGSRSAVDCASILGLPQLRYFCHMDSLGIVDSDFELSGKCGSFVEVCSAL